MQQTSEVSPWLARRGEDSHYKWPDELPKQQETKSKHLFSAMIDALYYNE